VKSSIRNSKSESTNFLNEGLKKQADRVITKLRIEPDPP
jgi:hypothetical protein